MIINRFILAAITTMAFTVGMAQTATQPTADTPTRTLPFGAKWAQEKGIDLPLPFGVSLFSITMSRDIDVENVDVKVANQPPQSINDFSSFGVRNQTAVTAIKFDTWILPVMNVYVLGGYATTDADLSANITIDRPISPRPPETYSVMNQMRVDGPYAGLGTSLVAGYKFWFVLADANYGKTWVTQIEDPINFTFLSVRSGIQGRLTDKSTVRCWLGAAYIHSKTTLVFKGPTESLADVTVSIEQTPVNPWTTHCGFMVGINRRWEMMAELGTNFDDASISVLTATWRF